MKNATTILENVILSIPANMRENAMEILKVRYLGQNTAMETAEILGLPYPVVVNVLKAVKRATRGKSPLDFVAC